MHTPPGRGIEAGTPPDTQNSKLPEQHSSFELGISEPPRSTVSFANFSSTFDRMAEPTHVIEPLAPETAHEYTISGPSLLGIGTSSGSSAENDTDLAYLYEDEPPRHTYWRVLFIFIVLAGVGSFLAYQWKQNASWHSAIIGAVTNAANRVRGSNQAAPANGSNDVTASSPNSAASSDSTSQPEASSNMSVAPPQASNPSGPVGSQDQATQAQIFPALPQSDKAGNGDQATPEKSNSGSNRNQLKTDNALAAATAPASPTDESDTSSPAKSRTPSESRQTKSAALLGHDNADAQTLVRADAFLHGNGVARNCTRALAMIRSVADGGYAPARVKLGALYATGQCTQVDRIRAYYWLTLAKNSDPKNQWIERNRKMLWSEMSQDERSRVTQAMP